MSDIKKQAISVQCYIRTSTLKHIQTLIEDYTTEYENRSDFIRTAIVNELQKNGIHDTTSFRKVYREQTQLSME